MDRGDERRLGGDEQVLAHQRAVTDAVASSRDIDWASLSDQCLDEFVQTHEQNARIYAVAAERAAAEIKARGLAGERGYASTAMYLQDSLGISLREARLRLRVADWTGPRLSLAGAPLPARYEFLAAAQADGDAGAEQVRIVASMLDDLPDAITTEVRVEAEQTLAKAARVWDPASLAKLTAKMAAALDPDGVLADEREQHQRRELSWHRGVHGEWVLRGRLGGQGMSLVRTVLEPLSAPVSGPDGEKDPRSAGQRRADAMVQVMTWQAEHPDMPSTGGRKPQLVVTIGLDELERRAGIGRLPYGDPVSVNTAVQLACDADAVLAVLRESGEVLFHSRKKRLVPDGLRAALVTRDRGCCFPGCDRPASWCVCHHIRLWSQGGETDITNCCLLCEFHHGVIHQGEWTLVMRDGRPAFIPPKWIDIQQRSRVNHMHDPPGPSP